MLLDGADAIAFNKRVRPVLKVKLTTLHNHDQYHKCNFLSLGYSGGSTSNEKDLYTRAHQHASDANGGGCFVGERLDLLHLHALSHPHSHGHPHLGCVQGQSIPLHFIV